MPRFIKYDVVIETANPREAVRLRSQGFKEQKAPAEVVKVVDQKPAKDGPKDAAKP